jgi:hypothetical protein
VFGYYEYRLDLGLVNDLPVAKVHQTPFGALVLVYVIKKRFINGSYDNRFGAGGGLSVRF